MRFSTTVLTLLTAILPILGAPKPLIEIERYNGETTGRYIVKLKDGVSMSSVTNRMTSAITHEWTIINGFAANLKDDELEALRANPDVDYISEDGIVHTAEMTDKGTDLPENLSTPSSLRPSDTWIRYGTWGVARLSTANKVTNTDEFTYNYKYTYDLSDGAGVDIYIIDTGVMINSTSFRGRARWGATFGPYPSEDVHGHGTHCAGTAAAYLLGVAQAANIIAVKVLGEGTGTGTISDIISGMNYVLNSAKASGRPSIASMSLVANPDSAMDQAVASMTNAGIHVVAAAGNDNTDAYLVSPCRSPSSICVGATNVNDGRAWFSNYGGVLDIFAPGNNIVSTSITSQNAVEIKSGTSMATPHVAGLIATLISSQGNISPVDMATKLRNLSRKNIISDIPGETVNALAQNGLSGIL